MTDPRQAAMIWMLVQLPRENRPTHKQIGDVMGLTVAAVRNRLLRYGRTIEARMKQQNAVFSNPRHRK